MDKDADKFVSNLEKAFIIQALKQDLRLDGRRPYDFRTPIIDFATDDSGATVRLGNTRVMSVVTATLEAPYAGRPHEGMVRFNVEFSPMASPAFKPGRPPEAAVMLARLVERSLKQSHAIDTEALCVLAGRKVWSLKVNIHVLDHCGNLGDAVCLAGLAGLLAFRKPDVSIVNRGNKPEVKLHPPQEKEPTPLTIHHYPIPVTIALYEEGALVAVDPSLQEEACMHGSCTFVMNQYKELCVVQKAQGIGLSPMQLMRCMRIATNCVEDIAEKLTVAAEVHKQARIQARIRRHHPAASLAPSSRTVTYHHPTTSVTNRDDVRAILKELEIQEEEDMAEDEEEEEDVKPAADRTHNADASDRLDVAGKEGVQGSNKRAPEVEMEDEEERKVDPASSRMETDVSESPVPSTSNGGEPEGLGDKQPLSKQAPKKKARVGKSKAGPVQIKIEEEEEDGGAQGFDMLEAIAATIAGAGLGASDDDDDDDSKPRDLRIAIKTKKGPRSGKP